MIAGAIKGDQRVQLTLPRASDQMLSREEVGADCLGLSAGGMHTWNTYGLPAAHIRLNGRRDPWQLLYKSCNPMIANPVRLGLR